MPQSKRNRKKKSQGRKKSQVSQSFTEDLDSELKKLDSLIEETETAVESFNYDEAETKLKDILHLDPNNIKCLEMLSGVYIEKFEWQSAKDTLQRCIEISPEVGYSKYFSIAQLCEGLESVKHYEKGIQLIEKQLENNENIEPSKGDNKSAVMRNLSDAYCSVAEIFMTDCCFEENAEEKCRTAIDLAIKSDSANPEAYTCLANYQLVKEQENEARESVQKSLSLWLPHYEREREGEIDQNPGKNAENIVPTHDSRIKTSKLLIEMEMYYEASKILEGLLDEDDEIVEVWYLLGFLNYMREEDEYKKTAHYYLRKAKEVGIKMRVEDDECVQHAIELIEELSSTHPISEDEEEEDNDEDDSDFSTDSEIDNEMETR